MSSRLLHVRDYFNQYKINTEIVTTERLKQQIKGYIKFKANVKNKDRGYIRLYFI